MEKRSLIFVFVGTGLLFAFLLVQGFRADKDLDQAENAANGEVQAVAQSDDSASEESKASDEKAEATGTEATGTKADDADDATKSQSESDAPSIQADEPVESEPEPDHKYVTIGSLAEGSPYLMLVTLNSEGAAVARVELASRLESGRYRYRDIDDHSGYLGHLFLEEVSGGLRVGVVGEGTPASLAKAAGVEGGIKPGDIIQQVNDVATDSIAGLHEVLVITEPGDVASLRVIRDESILDFQTTLTGRPMEVIRPEPEWVADESERHPESFLMSLRKPGEVGLEWPVLDKTMIGGNWEVAEATPDRVVFEKKLRSSGEKESAFTGEIIVRKIYRVAKVAEDAKDQELPAAYHLFTDVEIEQVGGESQELSLQVNGPTGSPIEGWWYTNKISGKTASLFSAAGARDVVLSTEANSFSFFGGPDIFNQALEHAKDPEEPISISVFTPNSTLEQKTVKFAGVDAQYFTIAMLPDDESNPFVVSNMYISPVHPVTKEDKKIRKKVDFSFRMYGEPIKFGPGEKYSQSFKVFAGPKEPQLLQQYGLGDTQTFGWFAIFSKILLSMLHFFHMIFRNYGVAIILLTVLVRLAMTPISRKAALNAQMMQMLQPEMKKLADKYKDDMEKRGQAQRELFKRYDYNPFGGCMLMFLQLPIFIGLYRGLSVDVALRDQPLIPGIKWCSNLAGPDQLWYWKEVIPFQWLTGETGWLGPYLNILPLITVVLFLMQQKLFTPPPTDEQQAMTQKMMTFMMLFIGLMFFKVPAGLCIYFITSSIWGIAERKLLPKPVLDKSKYDGLDDAESKKPPKKGLLSSLQDKMSPNKEPSTNGSAEDRKRRDKERQKKLRGKERDEG